MLVNERQELILRLLIEQQTLTLQELVLATDSSESTIRRDLTELERLEKLDRIHGGATIRNPILLEKSLGEKSVENLEQKKKLAEFATHFIQPGDCIYLDAGTTILQMIPFLVGKDVVVVTNGMTHLPLLHENKIKTYVIGGLLKESTQAFVGSAAVEALKNYYFDCCYLGVNGFDVDAGYTTPDPEEASVKHMAGSRARKCFVVADHTKYKVVKFSKIMELDQAILITEGFPQEAVEKLEQQTGMEVRQP